ncbi:hypothetical protein R1sor_013014 [Riccia sorocarpa]|uniref:Chitin-binding type-1 domain-containing protein n=1 Tax=Riccia sorocarpa TaxID=122646 RepID=A0ABD3H8V7_9MARC
MTMCKAWRHYAASVVVVIVLLMMGPAAAQVCGKDANNTLCDSDFCCSKFGFCGVSEAYCGEGCQSQCPPPSPPPGPPAVSTSGLDKTLNRSTFEILFPDRNSRFYTYDALILAANKFPEFGTEGNRRVRLREIAAFAAHVQQETAGLVYIREVNQSNDYCQADNKQWPCVPGQKYFGRGPIQLSWNFNYGPCGEALNEDLLAKPDLVAQDPVLAFSSALWFWTTKREGIPSVHDVLVGKYHPSEEDLAEGRYPGFGLTILIVNGGIECGKVTPQASNRVRYFKDRVALLGTFEGPYETCDKMTPYG